jgi:hypothetical protein
VAVRKEITVQHGFSQEEIAEAVKATLLLLGGCEERSPLVFESDVCASWIEWPGFRLTVDVTQEGILEIASESKVPWALSDWGTNREKIKKFIDALKHTFLISGLAKSKPEAYSSFMSDKSTHIENRSFSEIFLPFILIIVIVPCVVGIIAVVVLLVLIAALLFLGVLLSTV